MDALLATLPPLQYNVLVVDDEADVRSVTKLCLKNMKYKGVSVKVTEADSKAAAIKLLENNLGHPYVAAIIDVVMETDHAGLELVDYIRKTICNESMSIYLRTGQPGQAPEREVMETMSLDGYVLKTELTDEKLFTLTLASIKSTLRAWPYENAIGQLSLFKFGFYERKTFMERFDLAYQLADRLADGPKSTFAPGHYCNVLGKEYMSGDFKNADGSCKITPEVVAEMLAVAPDVESGPAQYRNYKELHSLYSQVSGTIWIGHVIEFTPEWKNVWVTFMQLFDHFVMNTKVLSE
jgi:CheY-like chemotaxis protein